MIQGSPYLYRDDGKSMVGIKNPDGSESFFAVDLTTGSTEQDIGQFTVTWTKSGTGSPAITGTIIYEAIG